MDTLDTKKYRQERSVENYLVGQLAKIGIETVKMEMGRGWPDRMILLGDGMVNFAECKARGKKVKGGGLQDWRIRRLIKRGYVAVILDTKEKVDQYMQKFLL